MRPNQAPVPETADFVVVGGGAAGVFAALICSETRPGTRIVVLEKGMRPLTKVEISGGGRCNATHSCFDPKVLASHYPRGQKELLGPFHQWQPRDMIEWFGANGVVLKTESDGRMFPVTDDSRTIIQCFLERLRAEGIELICQIHVRGVKRLEGGGFEVDWGGNRPLRTERVMIATGGLKPGSMEQGIKVLGHRVETLAPSLFTFHTEDSRLKGLAGVSMEQVEVTIPGTEWRSQGPVLVTHWGLSGPAILKLSAWAARWMQSLDYRFVCRINWCCPETSETLGKRFPEMKQEFARKDVLANPCFGIPRRLWERLVRGAEIPEGLKWSQMTREQFQRLVLNSAACEVQVDGKSMNKDEFVTCGGVSLKEVSFKTMESRLVPGLYFGGEVLDIDGVTGGFNFQAAWTTGYLAGKAVAQALG